MTAAPKPGMTGTSGSSTTRATPATCRSVTCSQHLSFRVYIVRANVGSKVACHGFTYMAHALPPLTTLWLMTCGTGTASFLVAVLRFGRVLTKRRSCWGGGNPTCPASWCPNNATVLRMLHHAAMQRHNDIVASLGKITLGTSRVCSPPAGSSIAIAMFASPAHRKATCQAGHNISCLP